MDSSLGFGLGRNAESQPVDSAAVELIIKRGPEYTIGGAKGTTAPHFAGVPPSTCKHVTLAGPTFDIAAATLSSAPPKMVEETTFWYPVVVSPTASVIGNTTQHCHFRLPGYLLDEV